MNKQNFTISIVLFFSCVLCGHSQPDLIQGKWFVVEKTALSDIEIPTRIVYSRDSIRFNSMAIADSMSCSELIVFRKDSTLNQSGECLPLDTTQYAFKYYGINGYWELLDKHTILIDYYAGLSIYHCTFRFRFKKNILEFILLNKEMEVFEEF